MIDKSSPIPMYFQLKEKLESMIKSGELKVGDRIYSENELCEMYDVSRITAKRALDEMVKEGYLYRLPGKGSFIQGRKIDHKLSTFYSFTEQVESQGMVPGSKIVEIKKISADEVISEALVIEEGTKVIFIKRLRMADDSIIALDHSFIPLTVCDDITFEELENNSLYQVLRNKGIIPDRAVEEFFAELLAEDDAKLLEAKPGTATLKVGRKTYSQDRLIEYNYRYYKGNQYRYTVELR